MVIFLLYISVSQMSYSPEKPGPGWMLLIYGFWVFRLHVYMERRAVVTSNAFPTCYPAHVVPPFKHHVRLYHSAALGISYGGCYI